MALISSIVRSTTSSPITFQNSSSTQIGTLCRAWVNFNGTSTVSIRGNFNVGSITDNGTGDYTVNITTAMADGNYAMIGTIGGYELTNHTVSFAIAGSSSATVVTLQSTTQVRVRCVTVTSNVAIDMGNINIAIFR
jgi:hypothetical protein